MARKLFCEYGPLAYKISSEKEKLRRLLQNRRDRHSLAQSFSEQRLPLCAVRHSAPVATEIKGVPQATVRSRANNIWLGAARVHGLLLHPGGTFSFWHTVGSGTPARG